MDKIFIEYVLLNLRNLRPLSCMESEKAEWTGCLTSTEDRCFLFRSKTSTNLFFIQIVYFFLAFLLLNVGILVCNRPFADITEINVNECKGLCAK